MARETGLRCLVAVSLAFSMVSFAGCSNEEPWTGRPAAAAKAADDSTPVVDEKPTDTAVPAQPASAVSEPAGTPYEVKVPLGLPPLPVPLDNPMTVEKIELGKMLYFDKRLSKDGSVSCATCHDPQMAWAEKTPVSTGIGQQKGGRNSPTVINSAYATSQFWDGRAKTLEEQALGPIANPIEMGHTIEAMVADLERIDGYKEHFQKVFGTGITQEGVAKALAAFERTVLSGNSPYDRYEAGADSALTDAQVRGLEKFEEAGCATCHAPALFSNYRFYNAGVGTDTEKPDAGLMDVTKKERDRGKFRVPSLRDVAKTAPYFHNGSAATLADAVALMAAGGIDNPNRSSIFAAPRSTRLNETDVNDIVAFLESLSGEYPIVEPPKLP